MKFGSYGDDEEDRKKAHAAPPPAPKPTPGYGPGGRGGGGSGEISQIEAAKQTHEHHAHTLPKEGASRRERGVSDSERQQAIAAKEAKETTPADGNSMDRDIAAYEQRNLDAEKRFQEKRPSMSPAHDRLNDRIRSHVDRREIEEPRMNWSNAEFKGNAEAKEGKSSPLADRIRAHKAAQQGDGNDDLRNASSRCRENVAARAENGKSPSERLEGGQTLRDKHGTTFSMDKDKGEVVRKDKDGEELGRWSKQDFDQQLERKQGQGMHR